MCQLIKKVNLAYKIVSELEFFYLSNISLSSSHKSPILKVGMSLRTQKFGAQFVGLTYELSSIKLQILLDYFQSHHPASFTISSIKGNNDFVTKPSFLLLPKNTADHGLARLPFKQYHKGHITVRRSTILLLSKKIPPRLSLVDSTSFTLIFTAWSCILTHHKVQVPQRSCMSASTMNIQDPLCASYLLAHSASSLHQASTTF